MKKLLTMILSLLLVVALCVPALADDVPQKGRYTWNGHTLEVTSVDKQTQFAPVNMSNDEYCITVTFAVEEAFWKDTALHRQLRDEVYFTDPDGNVYRASVNGSGTDNPIVVLFFAVSKNVEIPELTLHVGEREEAEPAETVAETPAATDGRSFTLGGICYTIATLDDAPSLILPNMMDGKEGHTVAFTYPVSGEEAEAANKLLYSGARLKQPNGDLVRAYSNRDNIGNPYILYFGLSDDVMLSDCTFCITDDNGEVTIPLGGAAEAAPSAVKAQAQEIEAPLPEDDGEVMILEILAQCAEEAKDEWQRAIYEAGARQFAKSVNEKTGADVYTFMMRSFNPQLKALGKFSFDECDAYWQQLCEHWQAYDLELSLEVVDGEVTEKSLKAFKTKVNKAAAETLTAMKDSRVAKAIASQLFYADFGESVKKAEALMENTEAYEAWYDAHVSGKTDLQYDQLLSFYYGQTKQTLSTCGGPFALELKCTSIDMEALIETAMEEAFEKLAYMDYDQRWDDDGVEQQLLLAMAENAISMRKNAKTTYVLPFNIDAPFFDVSDNTVYDEFMAQLPFEETMAALERKVDDLPAYAAVEMPKTGRLSGSTKGTQVRIKAPKDSAAFYVQFRDYETDEIVVTGFVQPGKTCSLRMHRGSYYIVFASGETWYGEELLFGDDTSFTKTGEYKVAGSNYYHTLTMAFSQNGNVPLYGADADDLN